MVAGRAADASRPPPRARSTGAARAAAAAAGAGPVGRRRWRPRPAAVRGAARARASRRSPASTARSTAARAEPAAQPVALPGRCSSRAVGRWRSRARLAGGSLELRWRAGARRSSRRSGRPRAGARQPDRQRDRARGPPIDGRGGLGAARLRIAVADSGRAVAAAGAAESPAEAIARLTGRRRRGHGLEVVRRVAAAHGGRFACERAESGIASPILELPLAVEPRLAACMTPRTGRRRRRAAAVRGSRRARRGAAARSSPATAPASPRSYGPLRPVVVASAALAAGEAIEAAELARALDLRRVPARFVPPGALGAPADALGLAPAAALPAGSYLLAAQLRPPPAPAPPAAAPAADGRPSRSRSAARALCCSPARSAGARVDVVVTTEPTGPGPGRTYVAAAEVPLLALGPAPTVPAGGSAAATLGLDRHQALRLIAAESFAREVRPAAADAGLSPRPAASSKASCVRSSCDREDDQLEPGALRDVPLAPPPPRSSRPGRPESGRRRCRRRPAPASWRPSSSATRRVLAVASRIASAEVWPPSSIVAAWITQLRGHLAGGRWRRPRRGRSGAASSLSRWISGPPACEIAAGHPAAMRAAAVFAALAIASTSSLVMSVSAGLRSRATPQPMGTSGGEPGAAGP